MVGGVSAEMLISTMPLRPPFERYTSAIDLNIVNSQTIRNKTTPNALNEYQKQSAQFFPVAMLHGDTTAVSFHDVAKGTGTGL